MDRGLNLQRAMRCMPQTAGTSAEQVLSIGRLSKARRGNLRPGVVDYVGRSRIRPDASRSVGVHPAARGTIYLPVGQCLKARTEFVDSLGAPRYGVAADPE